MPDRCPAGARGRQQFPEEYDGLRSPRRHPLGAPYRREIWPQIVMQESRAPIAANQRRNSAAVAVCDAADAVADGVINDPRKVT
jgi:hypothetical protein